MTGADADPPPPSAPAAPPGRSRVGGVYRGVKISFASPAAELPSAPPGDAPTDDATARRAAGTEGNALGRPGIYRGVVVDGAPQAIGSARRRRTALRVAFGLLAVLLIGAVVVAFTLGPRKIDRSIRVGILHSTTGSMAFSERAVVDATVMAIDELNARGGLLGGRRLHPVIADGASDEATFAREARRLIETEQVSVIFGCWTSASRKAVRPVVEGLNSLLVYPVQYEGLETSPNILYVGAAPNQQIIPAVHWVLKTLGRRVALVGSDYVFPRTANAIIRDQVTAQGGDVVAEEYVPLGGTDFRAIAARLARLAPDVLLNTVNGDSNVALFRALRAEGLSSAQMPTLSFSLAEPEVARLRGIGVAGDYAAWTYFQSLPRPENRAFVAAFKARYGDWRVVGDPMEAAYTGVHLWAQAVEKAQTDDPELVRQSLPRQSFNGPAGIAYVDPETRHLWKTVRIGRIRPDGQFDIVWDLPRPVQPVSYPLYRSRADWDAFLVGLSRRWDGAWTAPQTADRSSSAPGPGREVRP